jgi:hypothetical protein
MEFTVGRSTRSFDRFSAIKAGLVGSTLLMVGLSCFDSTAPVDRATADGVVSVNIIVPDSLKNAPLAQSAAPYIKAPLTSSVSGFISPATTLSSAVAGHPMYAVSHVPFAPEPIPSIAPSPLYDDGFLNHVPLGFSFSFYGNTYTEAAVYSNGFVMFSPATMNGFWYGDPIPSTTIPNNIIALAWTDWQPNLVPGSIRYQTRGTAPNRRFILQFTNVPEYAGTGMLTSQLVLAEGSNDITIYTASVNITFSGHRMTQGIENASGTEAAYDSVQNAVTGVWAPRVNSIFSLSNDALRFSIWHANLPPAITAPANLSVNTDPASNVGTNLVTRLVNNPGPGTCSALVNPGTPTVTDDATGTTVLGVRSDAPTPLDAAYPKGLTTITWTATDAGGLTATATQTITVIDKELPSITAPASVSTRTDRGASTATVILGSATATDNCPNVAVVGTRSDAVPLSAAFPVGMTTITWTATDASGNSAAATQMITVIGNTAPILTTPANISVNTDPGVCSALVNPGTATATDDVAGTVVVGVRNDGAPLTAAYPKGLTAINWTATDVDGLTAVGSQQVSVSDMQPPMITPPQNMSVRTDRGAMTATVVAGTATATDNCPNASVAGTRSDGAALSAPYPIGNTTINWRATDGAGNVANATQVINVVGNVAPTLTAPPSLAVNTDPGVCKALVNVGNATATDDTPGTVVVGTRSDGYALDAAYPKGITTITWTATDVDGLSASATRTVTVSDRENPSITAPASMLANTDPNLATANVAAGTASAADNCPNVTVQGARTDGAAMSAPYPMGKTTITWTATDASGNMNTATQTITVLDNTPPTLSVPVNLTVNATMPSGAVVVYLPLASDNVAVSSVSCSPASGSVFPIGQTLTTCTATDEAGNTKSTTFVVTVRGAREQMKILMDQLSGMNLPNGVENPLLNQLLAAYRKASANDHVSCVKMSDFISMLGGTKGASLSSSAAVKPQMIEDGQRIMNVIGC